MLIPDLRDSNREVTLEHCSHLLERLNDTLGVMYPEGPDEFKIICDAINPEMMREDLFEMFTPKAFENLFASQLGKGVLIGAFVQKFLTEDSGLTND